MCESQLSKLITLKNVADMLDFSFVYQVNFLISKTTLDIFSYIFSDIIKFSLLIQAEQLKRTCLQFICINLSALLESRILEQLEPEILAALDAFYLTTNSVFGSRTITPLSGIRASRQNCRV